MFFWAHGLILYKEEADGRGINLAYDTELTFKTEKNLSVAHGVAASSAFPPMFPPLKIDSTMLDRRALKSLPSECYLSDGGVFDNLGMDRPLWWYLRAHKYPVDQIRKFLMIDAEGPFNQVARKPWRYKFMLLRNIRATEVMMKRISTLNWKFLSGLGLTLVRIPEPPVKSVSPPELELAQAIRTDLDRFSNLEIEVLVGSGYRAALAALQSEQWIDKNFSSKTWCPVPKSEMTPEQRKRKLLRARYRRWLPLFFGFRDRVWWLLFFLTILFAFLMYLYACHCQRLHQIGVHAR